MPNNLLAPVPRALAAIESEVNPVTSTFQARRAADGVVAGAPHACDDFPTSNPASAQRTLPTSHTALLRRLGAAVALSLMGAAMAQTASAPVAPTPACDKPVYLSFRTGSMEVAPLVAVVLQRHARHVLCVGRPDAPGRRCAGQHLGALVEGAWR